MTPKSFTFLTQMITFKRKILLTKNMETLFLSPLAIVIIASIVGFFMAYGIGANDVANAMGTSVGSKAITLKQAIIICLLYTSPSPRDRLLSRMPSSA